MIKTVSDHAREYLLEHALQPPSLTELAKIAGINEFKLKQGFKQVFNNTVYGYLSDYKLNQARELLVQGNMAIKKWPTIWATLLYNISVMLSVRSLACHPAK